MLHRRLSLAPSSKDLSKTLNIGIERDAAGFAVFDLDEGLLAQGA